MRLKLLVLTLAVIVTAAMIPYGSFAVFAAEPVSVYIGGFPFTVDINNNGAIIIDRQIDAQNLPYELNKSADLKKGDVIIEVNGAAVSSSRDVEKIISENKTGSAVTLKYKRGDKSEVTTILPVKEECSGKYKLGYWLKDKLSGLGTMTFITKKRTFAALGHGIIDDETGVQFECKQGSLFECKLMGVEKGKSGTPGRLKGRCVNCMFPKGEVYQNDAAGLYGKYTGDVSELPLYEVASADEVKIGGAKIMSNVIGATKSYDIEIVRTFKQSLPTEKGMVIKVTDNSLIELTGGIVQGMSGSPIVQDGKIIGAVTHVFTNNPQMGYGIYSEWMMQKAVNCKNPAA